MRWNSRALHLVRRLRCFAVALVCTLLVSSVYAAGGSVRVTPVSSVATSPSTTRTVFEVATVSLDAVVRQTEYQARSAALSSRTVGSLARKALRGGVYGVALGLAVEGLIDGAGWAINELKDQVSEPATGTTMPSGTRMWCSTTNNVTRCTTTQGGAVEVCSSVRGEECRFGSVETGDSWRIRWGGTTGGSMIFSPRIVSAPQFDWGSGTSSPRVVPDEELGDLVREQPELLNDLLIDPRTGYPMPTPELQKQIDDLKKEVEDREGIPNSDPSPAPDLEDDTAADSESQWPTFCGWATKVCEFIDWFKKPTDKDVDLPEQEIDIDTKGWSSGIGGGSCPGPSEFSVTVVGQNGTAAYEWQPVCDFATKMRPFLIFVCSLVSVLIIAGLRGGSKA